MANACVTVRLEAVAADLLAASVRLLREVEEADEILIPDHVAEAAKDMRRTLERWRDLHA